MFKPLSDELSDVTRVVFEENQLGKISLRAELD
jgi:hypothetical protein